jgi:hypothetical protein
MTKTKRAPLTDDQREEKRAADRELVKRSVEALRSSDGWQNWLKSRSRFHSYSLGNQLLIAVQSQMLLEAGFIERMPVRVAGFQRWLKMGYCVSKRPEYSPFWGLKIWMPASPTQKQIREAQERGEEKPRMFFILGNVFGDPQVHELDEFEGDRVPLSPPIVDIDGDDMIDAWGPLELLCGQFGCPVRVLQPSQIPASLRAAYGYYDKAENVIVLNGRNGVNNALVSTLIHETAHMLVRRDQQDDDPKMEYAEEELVAESVAMSVCGTLGFDTSANSIPYLTSWSERIGIDALEDYAKLTDRLCRELEDALDDVIKEAV